MSRLLILAALLAGCERDGVSSCAEACREGGGRMASYGLRETNPVVPSCVCAAVTDGGR